MMKTNYRAKPEQATSKTSVWWDMNDYPVPVGYDACRIRPSIEGALKELGYNGPVSITAYGDLKQSPQHVLRRLSSTGVSVQQTVKELRCSYMYSDLMEWREHNPPPATIMLISNQVKSVFTPALSREQQRKHGYNIVVAYTRICRDYSLLLTTAEWLWGSLLLTATGDIKNETGESAVLCCRSCGYDTQTLAKFTKHLSAEQHADKETSVSQSTRPTVGPEYEQSQIKKMPRNYTAPPEYAASQISVWWDMGDCPVPVGYDACLVRPSIEGALKSLGYNGPVTITAYDDLKQTPQHVLRGLSSTAVALQHTHKDKRGSFMLGDLLLWHYHNPPPATIMFICDQVENNFFSLCRLLQHWHGYKLVLASKFTSSQASLLVTSAEWLWGSLLTDSETPRHVLHKCSQTGESAMFYCKLCRFEGQSLEIITKHLYGEEHAQTETRISNIRLSADYEVHKSKRLRKAFRTDFRLGNYLRSPYRRGARKEKLVKK